MDVAPEDAFAVGDVGNYAAGFHVEVKDFGEDGVVSFKIRT